MESENRAENSEGAYQHFLRVELDDEHKKFTKQCEADGCTAEFTTNVPRKYFENPDDASTELLVNGDGTIPHTGIRAADVERHIFNREFPHTHHIAI